MLDLFEEHEIGSWLPIHNFQHLTGYIADLSMFSDVNVPNASQDLGFNIEAFEENQYRGIVSRRWRRFWPSRLVIF